MSFIVDEPYATEDEALSSGDFPGFDDVEAVGLDGTRRFESGSGPWGIFTWADLEEARENIAGLNAYRDARDALKIAGQKLNQVLAYLECLETSQAFSSYPSELPSFDELAFAVNTIELDPANVRVVYNPAAAS